MNVTAYPERSGNVPDFPYDIHRRHLLSVYRYRFSVFKTYFDVLRFRLGDLGRVGFLRQVSV